MTVRELILALDTLPEEEKDLVVLTDWNHQVEVVVVPGDGFLDPYVRICR